MLATLAIPYGLALLFFLPVIVLGLIERVCGA